MSERPSWNSYFLQLAEMVSTRSPDPSTQHGCVIVAPWKRIVSTGYNGPIAGMDHSIIPLDDSRKYHYMIHAEINAILFARENLEGCTAYITGAPCPACFRALIQSGVRTIFHSGRGSKMIGPEEEEAVQKMSRVMGVQIEER